MPDRKLLLIGFVTVMLIWSTTPLAIKWSGEGPGFLFGVLARMVIGCVLLLVVSRVTGAVIPWHRQALHTYSAAAFGIVGTMLSVYWGAQYIPSGMTSVIFGLTPIITGILAARVLAEDSLTIPKITGSLIGLVGLIIIFGRGHTLGEGVMGFAGALAIFFGVIFQSASAVWVKRTHGNLPALTVTTGSMMVSMPFFILAWLIGGGHWPEVFPMRALSSIVYLGAFATVVGFVTYFYILKHMQTGSVALLNLISPVFALLVGFMFNDEVIGPGVWLGAALILGGMSVYQWGKLPMKPARDNE